MEEGDVLRRGCSLCGGFPFSSRVLLSDLLLFIFFLFSFSAHSVCRMNASKES